MATNNLAYIATETTITVILNGKYKTIQVRSKNQRNDVINALEKYKKSEQTEKDFEELDVFLAPVKRILLESDNRLELDTEGNKLFLSGTTTPIEPGLATKILDFLDHGLSVEPLIKFWISCLRNPHFIAVQELFNFLEQNNLPITDDGGFLGYKKLNFVGGVNLPENFGELFVDTAGTVRTIGGKLVSQEVATSYLSFISEANNPTMKDVWSGTIKQKIGDVVRIDRIKFDEEARREACGYGLHIGSFGYSFGGNVRVLCKVMPEDVIACNPEHQKLRTCKYQIVSFVDSSTEITQLLVNLTKEEQEIANGEFEGDDDFIENPFEEGDIVKAVETLDLITKDNLYYITDIDDELICVVNDEGDESWYEYFYFENR